MARKCLSDENWEDWLVRYSAKVPKKLWFSSWRIFTQYRESVEQEREYLFANRVHDELWYSAQFDLSWPIVNEDPEDEEEEEDEEEGQPFPNAPSPSPSASRKGFVTASTL
jgi:hypothetical protein